MGDEFFDTLKNEGMKGVLKKYTPINVLLENLEEENTKLKKEVASLRKIIGNTKREIKR